MNESSFQDQIKENHCWGCGPANEHGLRIKSYWSGEEAVCTWQPGEQHSAAPLEILNGGVIATRFESTYSLNKDLTPHVDFEVGLR